MTLFTLVKVTDPQKMHAGGTVTYLVMDRNGSMVGMLGDGRDWKGWRYGGRRWWACWRQEGDQAARWSTDLDYPTRKGALYALVGVLGTETAR
ncbi:hypothetical protein BJF90_26390 [Pseudonocardia sp. CNS-004]|nr:hypothetical protein BJF90_26390 [Pseudonocardia sp. CNS-004]